MTLVLINKVYWWCIWSESVQDFIPVERAVI